MMMPISFPALHFGEILDYICFVNGLIIKNFLLIVEVKTVQATLNHPLYHVGYPAAREPVKRKA